MYQINIIIAFAYTQHNIICYTVSINIGKVTIFISGYYRINYDEPNWQALVGVMQSSPSSIPVLNRAQLVDDSFNLARNGRLVRNNYQIYVWTRHLTDKTWSRSTSAHSRT